MIDGLLMAAFRGRQPAAALLREIAERAPAGLTLFRAHDNVGEPAELRALTDALQAATPAAGRPLLIAADQEGGQLIGLGASTTQFAGAMALGAAGDSDLAERVARATAREMRALGVNVNYAPVCDLATNPANPSLGIRSFGAEPHAVAKLVAATVRGLQAEGVAATAKHFPGKGEAAVDSHHQLPIVERSREELLERELVPFRAAIEAGARLVMSGHFAAPSLSGDPTLPNTLAGAVMAGLLRDELGFAGIAITDALDMRALSQGPLLVVEAVAALAAGNDLLLMTPDIVEEGLLAEALGQAERRGLVTGARIEVSRRRVADLRGWLAGFTDRPGLEVVGCAEHAVLAAELAARSITLVRDDAGLLPLRLGADQRLAVLMPRPSDLTPADTSSSVAPALAASVRRRHAKTDEILFSHSPTAAEVGDVVRRVDGAAAIVLATISASLEPAQAELARAILDLGRPTVTVALRTPWDLAAYPQATTHLCSYGLHQPSLDALAAVVFGDTPAVGRLPVSIAGLYTLGHRLER